MKYKVHLDYETRSEADLTEVGAVTYAQHPSTEIMCLAYKINDEPTKIWVPTTAKHNFPDELARVMNYDENANLLAHNAGFEQVITEFVLKKRYTSSVRYCPPRRWNCSAARAAACALPRKLEHALEVLKAPIRKDMVGHKLMLKHSKPRPTWVRKKTGAKYFEDPKERAQIYSYCIDDVEGEAWLDTQLPDLIPFERRVWILNQEMNLRGVRVDVDTAYRIVDMIAIEARQRTADLFRITKGKVTTVNEVAKMVDWVRRHGVSIPNLQAETIDTMLEMKNIPDNVKEVLDIRRTIGKSSIKKYPALINRVSFDGRVKDYSMYHGAHTGRESGKGLQLQNLAKGKIKNTDEAIDVINTSTLEEIRMLYGRPFEVFASCMRGMIMASGGHKLYVADYNAIEARVLQWLSGDEAGLERFRKGIDVYVLIAEIIYGCKVDKLTAKGAAMREVGKRAELGCGYQMGGKKFYETCLKYGAKDVTPELCEKAVNTFRFMHPKIVSYWADTESAAINAVKKVGRGFDAGRCRWQMEGKFLWCRLPSGRRMAYYRPTVRYEPAPWGELFPKLYHWKSNPTTKQWENHATYGGRLVENVTQGAARDICVNGMMNLDQHGYSFLFMVHDEIVAESPKGNVAEFEKLITDLPSWAAGLPITAKGWRGPRYKKV